MYFQNRPLALLIVLAPLLYSGCSPEPRLSNTTFSVEELRQQARSGNNELLFALGERYANGNGVARDNVLAYMWYSLATEFETTEKRYQAGRMQLTLDREMFRHQIAEADRLATLWKQQWR
tara:strand:- start:34 stop:396 length:363 start_codon:yes stop_codon:yes gene_type:complete